MNYAEIHFHLLPGIDDGPSTLADSAALAAAAAADGTRAVYSTPHIHPEHVVDVRILPELVGAVSAHLRAHDIPIDVRCGGELDVGMVARLSQDELELIAGGPRDARWLLLEAPLDGLRASFTAAADELRARGFTVVMAHPERSLVDRDAGWTAIDHEIAAGSVIQVNAWSVLGHYGERVRADALAIVRRAPVAALASDAHGPHRPPLLTPALAQLADTFSPELARRVAALSPELLRSGPPRESALAA